MLETASAATVAPVGELDAIPMLARTPAERTAADAPDASSDLLCSKGAAVATRARSYDHKDAFEPAPGATAPPSDADVLGSWLKYEGSLPVPTDQAQAVVDEERPTSWCKYETKPMASLLESIEKPRSKPRVQQLESARTAAFAPPEPTAVAEAAPEPSDHQTEVAPAEPIAVVVALPDPVVAPTTAVAITASEPQPEISASAIEEDPVATCDTATPPSSPPDPEISVSIVAIVAPQECPHEPVSLERHESPASPLAETSASPAETPSALAASIEGEPHPEPIAQFPAIESGTDGPPQDEPSVAPDDLAALAAAPSVELDAESNAPVSASAAPIEEARIARPEEAAAPAVGASSSAKKAMLARLAEMLERALSAKRAASLLSEDLPPAASDGRETPPMSSDVLAPEPSPAPGADFVAEAPVAPANETETVEPVSAPEAHATEPQPVLAQPQETAAEIVASPEELGAPERPEAEAPIAVVSVPSSIEAATAEIDARPIETEDDSVIPEARVDDDASEWESASIDAIAIEASPPARKAASTSLVRMLGWALSKRTADEPAQVTDTTDLERSATASPSEDAPPPETAIPSHELADLPAANAETIDLEAPVSSEPEATIVPAETGSQLETSVAPPSNESALIEAAPVPEIEPTIVDVAPPTPIDQVASFAYEATPPTDVAVAIDLSHETFVAPPEVAYAEVTDASLAAVSPPEGEVDEPAPSEPAAEASAIPFDVDAAPPAAQEPAPFPPAPMLPSDPAPEAMATEPEPVPVSPNFSTMVAEVAETTPLLASETPKPIVAEVAPAAQPRIEIAALIEAAPIMAPAGVVPPSPPAPLTRAQQEKVAREALTHDLADVIHNVLSTTQFATKALKPMRYSAEEPVEGLAASDFAEDLAATLPHPVVVRSRIGRMERALALASVGMLAMVGYFAFSLWHGEAAGPAKATAISIAAPLSDEWGERARDMTRELGAIATVTDAPTAHMERSEPGVSKPASPPHSPQIVQ